MSENKRNVSIQLLEKTYHVDCPAEEIPTLQEAALYLDDKLYECARHLQKPNQQRLALMTALNISHELMTVKKQHSDYVKTMSERIKVLQNKIDETLIKQQEIDLES